jgi:predicted DNA-binding transcriptional regulator YafY
MCRSLIRPYFIWSGLFQSWDMFAPIPKMANTYIEAVIVYRNGSRKNWTLPQIEQLGLRDKYLEEHYRKFADNLQQDENEPLLADAARRIARLNSGPGGPVSTVILIQQCSFIACRADGKYVPEAWLQHVLLGYGVRPQDLK